MQTLAGFEVVDGCFLEQCKEQGLAEAACYLEGLHVAFAGQFEREVGRVRGYLDTRVDELSLEKSGNSLEDLDFFVKVIEMAITMYKLLRLPSYRAEEVKQYLSSQKAITY
ncbi:MAG: hypothetical protein ABIG95_01585 [Candidatus Woesearchaeota archaeon]